MASPEGVAIGVITGVADALIWKHFVGPSIADIRTAEPFNGDIEKAERTALIAGSVFTLLVAGFTRSAEVFAIGGTVLVGLDFATKHANAVNPQTGKIAQGQNESTSYPMPEYSS